MNKNKTPSRIIFACPRGLQIPETINADISSVRVADPLLKPCGLQIHGDKQSTWTKLLFVSVVVSMSSGIYNPRVNNCGYVIRASRRPAVRTLWTRVP